VAQEAGNTDHFREWIAEGKHGEMAWMESAHLSDVAILEKCSRVADRSFASH
jgi:hypothetical protein